MKEGNEIRESRGCLGAASKVIALFLLVAVLLSGCNQKLYNGTKKRTPNPVAGH